ncbi:unnamed protein product [Pleuronectes platessa]|uniref:Uncharacterized protein n=1 Tax=Pleuronectes platessa TaxID=8262 RepID=A0A9N7V722_PLEPL|nr:unnamed protein product [Pleuronectes platessa]
MPKRKCSFTDELLKSFPAFRPGRDKWEALCTVCKAGTYVSVSNGGARDLKIHLDTEKHKTAVRGEGQATYHDLFWVARGADNSGADAAGCSATRTEELPWPVRCSLIYPIIEIADVRAERHAVQSGSTRALSPAQGCIESRL